MGRLMSGVMKKIAGCLPVHPLVLRKGRAYSACPGSAEVQHVKKMLRAFDDYGHMESFKRWSSIDGKGNPVPWYTYGAIDYLKQMDLSHCSVFEFGIGNSTLFWASKAKQVVSVEDNREWYERVKGSCPANASVSFCATEDEYVTALDRHPEHFDIIVVDGSFRARCAEAAIRKIRPGGIIILDNTDRWQLQDDDGKALATLNTMKDFIRVDFSGFSPINYYVMTTSIFLPKNFTFTVGNPSIPVVAH